APARAARIAARPASTARPSALRPSRWPTTIIGLVVLVATAWGFAASAYLIMRGDAVVEVKQERAAMQTAYEERISRLRSEVDAVNSRLMLDQDAFEAKLEALRQRQAMLERRQTELATLVDGARHPALKAIAGLIATEATGSLTVVHEGAEAEEAQKAREIRLSFPARGGPAETGTEPAAARNPAEHALNRLSRSQDRMEASQRAILEGIEAGAILVSRHIEEAIADLGFDAEKMASRPISSAPTLAAASSLGGPFIPTPLNGPDAKSPFERQVARARERIARSIGLYDGLMALPVRRPLSEKRDVTSNFGVRRDPFEGRMAMHAGIDFRAGRGTPVRAPAAGVVTLAGRNAGYGKMIEIEHKNGVSTRYGHLSAISVAKGQRVKAGEIIGRVGSTGRSTGPHLHYETRIKGEPTDPRRFLEIADRLQVSIAAH
ncbi:MAG TPA: peptidoglycan DD-metalloendopeptidase family protein, partial [Hyphomicrobiales bacterium]|nr:peptidoglycan DD-metalloendopeptidase family protein [Hyphomicrobiales bacterium]